MSDQPWRPSRVLRLLLWWTSLVFLTAWLPLVRGAFDGASYEWGTSYFGRAFAGAGVGGDYWLPIVRVAFGLLLLVLGWRGARGPFPWLLVGWQAFGLADAVHSAVTDPEAFRFRGDTLGVDVSLAWLAPTFYAAALFLSLWWLAKRRGEALARDPGWSTRNFYWLAALAALLPIQLVLLRSGAPHGTTDQLGVVLTMVQWFLLPFALRVRTPAPAAARSVA